MKRPFLNIVILYIIAILFFYYIQIDLYLILLFSIVSLVLSIYLKDNMMKEIFFNIFIITIAGLILYLNINTYKTKDFIGKEVDSTILIKELVNENDYSNTYEGKIINIYDNEKSYKIDEKSIIKIKNKDYLEYNTIIKAKVNLLKAKSNTNKGLFNYFTYLKTKKIHSIADLNKQSYEIIGRKKSTYFSYLKINSKTYIEDFLHTSLNKKNASVMKAIILGDDSLLDEDYKDKYRQLGIAHILAISGLHIGIIAGALLFVFGNLAISYKISSFITLIFIFTYGYIVGFPASILRASMILFMIIIARIFFKRPDYINSISLVGLILLLYNPLWIFDIGFQLSFIATLSIVILTPIISKKIFLEVRFAKTFSALISVQLGTLPLLIYHFNYISLTSLFSNMILIPILSYVLIATIILLGLSIPFFNLSITIMKIIDITLNYFTKIINFHHNYLNIVLNDSSWYLINIVSYYIIIYIMINIKKIKKLKYGYINMFFYTVLLVTILNFLSLSTFKWSINFIDVGQGDSSLIRIKDKAFLIDTGGNILSDYDLGEKLLIPYLLKNNIRKLDGVFISHFHEDHTEGLISLLKTDFIKVKKIYYNQNNIKNNLYKEIKNISKLKNIEMIQMKNQNKLKVYDIAEFGFFNNEKTDLEENNNSNIISMNTDQMKILYMGDAEKELEDEFIKHNKAKYDIIKIGHHGSGTSTSINLLENIKPNLAIISVGKNSYGHPNEEVLENLKNENIRVKRTDIDGNILIKNSYKNYDIYLYNEKRIILSLKDVFNMILFMIILFMDLKYIEFQNTKEKLDGI